MKARFNPSRHKDAVSVRVLTIPISAHKDYNGNSVSLTIKNQAPFVEHFFTKKNAFSFIEQDVLFEKIFIERTVRSMNIHRVPPP